MLINTNETRSKLSTFDASGYFRLCYAYSPTNQPTNLLYIGNITILSGVFTLGKDYELAPVGL